MIFTPHIQSVNLLCRKIIMLEMNFSYLLKRTFYEFLLEWRQQEGAVNAMIKRDADEVNMLKILSKERIDRSDKELRRDNSVPLGRWSTWSLKFLNYY